MEKRERGKDLLSAGEDLSLGDFYYLYYYLLPSPAEVFNVSSSVSGAFEHLTLWFWISHQEEIVLLRKKVDI